MNAKDQKTISEVDQAQQVLSDCHDGQCVHNVFDRTIEAVGGASKEQLVRTARALVTVKFWDMKDSDLRQFLIDGITAGDFKDFEVLNGLHHGA